MKSGPAADRGELSAGPKPGGRLAGGEPVNAAQVPGQPGGNWPSNINSTLEAPVRPQKSEDNLLAVRWRFPLPGPDGRSVRQAAVGREGGSSWWMGRGGSSRKRLGEVRAGAANGRARIGGSSGKRPWEVRAGVAGRRGEARDRRFAMA